VSVEFKERGVSTVKGKREFNESQRNELIQNADSGQNQVDYFYGELSNWAATYKKYDSAGLAGKAKSYFTGLDSTLEKGKEDINKIFTAAEEVENEYAGKLEDVAFEMGLYADKLNALLSVLQPVAPLASGPNLFAAPDFKRRLAKTVTNIQENEAAQLAEHYLKGGKWKDYIAAQMERAPQDIAYAEYLAMINIFEQLGIKDKENFIRMSYRELPCYSAADGTYPAQGGLAGDQIANDTQWHTYYELSPVFATMALVAGQRLKDMPTSYDKLQNTTSDIHRQIFSSQLLYNIALYGSALFYNPYGSFASDKFEVQLSKVKDTARTTARPYDYTFSVSGYTTLADVLNHPTKWLAEFSFTTCQFRDGGLMNNTVLKDNVSSIADSMIPRVDLKAIIGKDLFEFAVGLIPYKHIGDIAGVVFPAADIARAYEAEREALAKAGKIDESLDYGNLAIAACFDTALTLFPDGSFAPDYIVFSRDKLQKRLDKYNLKVHGNSEKEYLKADDVIGKITSGEISDTDLQDYVRWRINIDDDKDI
jgi:hypothetical protein